MINVICIVSCGGTTINSPSKIIRMTRLRFGVSASPFVSIMAMRQNAVDHQRKYPLAAQAVMEPSMWTTAIKLRVEMQELFELGGFVLKKWKSSEPAGIADIPHELVDSQSTQSINIDHYTKVLATEWITTLDTFQSVVSSLNHVETLT